MSYPKHRIVSDLAKLNREKVADALKMAQDLGATLQGVDLREKIQEIMFTLNTIGDNIGKDIQTKGE